MIWTTGPDCPALMCNLINTHTHMSVLFDTHTHIHTHTHMLGVDGEVRRKVGRGAPSLSDSRLYLLRQMTSN